jgi:arsenate reductase (thioredoxin)
MQTILYVCVHNAGRSQMAEALTNALAQERRLPVRAVSAGTQAGERLNPMAKAALEEIGIETAGLTPKPLTAEMAEGADRVITMGCGVNAEACPARILIAEDWGLDDPAGQPMETVRVIRDEIRAKVTALLDGVEAAQ